MVQKITRKDFLKALPMFVPAVQAWARPAANDQRIELRSEGMRVTVVASRAGVWLEKFFLKRSKFDAVSFTSNLWTNDLLHPVGGVSALLPEEMEWQAGHLGPEGRVTTDASSVHITGILLGPDTAPAAREDWTVALHQDELQWRVEREYLRQVTLRADRFPSLAMQTTAGEIVSFLDPAAQLQSPGLFPLEKLPMGEIISPTRAQQLHLSPSGLVLESKMTAGYFSFAKDATAGTARMVVIGSESVDRTRGKPEVRRAGAKQVQEWTLRRLESAPLVPLQLELPDEELAQQARSFADVHNQWMGWMFSNNPASVSCNGELAWFPMLQGIYPADPTTQHAFDRQLEFVSSAAVDSDAFDPSGHVMPYWTATGFIESEAGRWRLPTPHFILAVYEQVISTGQRAFLERMMPTLDRVAVYLLAMDRNHDGVFEDTNAGLPDGGHHAGNWFDIIEFGHKDGMVNVYAVAALDAMAEMKAYLGDAAAAQHFREFHARSKAAYNQTFWDDERGFYRDWIDVREHMPESGRRYFYTDHNLLAIIYGIADSRQAQRILGALDARYGELCQQFQRQRDDLWATPANMYPVTQLGDLFDNGELLNQKEYPNYENGCSFFHTTGLEIAARGAAGQAEQAYATFEWVMLYGYAQNRLWAAALQWNTGRLVSEPLNNALLILWGFAYGCLGIRRTLQGINTVGGSSLRLEGAKHTFRCLGKNVTVQVQQGRPVRTASG